MKFIYTVCATFLATSLIFAADVPAPGYRDIASKDISDITVLISQDNGYSPTVSFRTTNERFVFSQGVYSASEKSNASSVSAIADFVELLREANYISIKAKPTNRSDPTDLPIFEISDVGFHYKK